MPHLTFQYSANLAKHLDIDALFLQLHRCLRAWPFVEQEYIKSKKQAFEDVLIGDEAPGNAFLHCEVALFIGRPAIALHELRESLQVILHQAALKAPLCCWISVELREMPMGSLIAAIVPPA